MPTMNTPKGLSTELDFQVANAKAATFAAEQWARENGYVIAPGVTPRRIYRDGRIVYRILFLRTPSDTELRARQQKIRQAFDLLQAMPSTKHPYFE